LKTFTLLLVLGISSVCTAAEEPEYKGKSLDYWISRTQTEHSQAERREAIRTLGQIGYAQSSRMPNNASNEWISATVVPVLNGLLKDKDDAVRAEAVRAICGINRKASKDTIPALTELLGDPIKKVRETAADALCYRGPAAEPAIPTLVKAIAQDASPEVRKNAALALRTSGPQGVEALLGMLDDKSVQVRRTATSAFEFRHPDADPYETPHKAVPKFVALLDDESPEVRKSAALAIVRISELPLDTVFLLLRHKDVVVRRAAVENLSFGPSLETDEFRTALFECMKDDKDYCRERPDLLSHAGPKSIPILITLLDDRSPAVRGHAASALGALRPAAKEAVGPLKRLLSDKTKMPYRDDDERVCHCAAEALNRILGDKDYREGLPELTPDGL
jgi:hypothetical protein